MKKNVIGEAASRIQTEMRKLQRELEQMLKDYIAEHGNLDFTHLEDKIYTTLFMWGETASTCVEGVVMKNGVLFVVADDGQWHDYDEWTNDTLVDICYCADIWPTDE